MKRLQPTEFRLRVLDWQRVYVMGVVNVTPDSFSDGGRFLEADRAAAHARELERAGADVIDIGGESTRPGATPVGEAEERARVLPIIAHLAGQMTLSIDTYKAAVADAALATGAELVNDISGGALDPDLLGVVARRRAAVVLGHLRGRPAEMMTGVHFDDVAREVREELGERVARALEAGIPRARILVDPGLGFGKAGEHNLALLARLGELVELGCPVVVGASRKSFLGKLTTRPLDERECGTAAANAAAILQGANMVRVHDVGKQRDAVLVAEAIRAATTRREGGA